jgi:hypothetical protein
VTDVPDLLDAICFGNIHHMFLRCPVVTIWFFFNKLPANTFAFGANAKRLQFLVIVFQFLVVAGNMKEIDAVSKSIKLVGTSKPAIQNESKGFVELPWFIACWVLFELHTDNDNV